MNESSTTSFQRAQLCRRTFLAQTGLGLGTAALSTLLGGESQAASNQSIGLPTLPNLPQKVKRVIFLCMAGGPSHLETFDYKPALEKISGQPMPESYTKGQQIAQLQGQELIAQGPMTKFGCYGKSGQTMSDFFPYHREIADDICIIKSMVTEQINHDPAHTFMNTGTVISGRPSMGSWVNYGLGCENKSLPGFVVLVSQEVATRSRLPQDNGRRVFCPANIKVSLSIPPVIRSITSTIHQGYPAICNDASSIVCWHSMAIDKTTFMILI